MARKPGKDTDKRFEVIETLANGEPLEERYRDHDLTDNYAGCRSCHIDPDWLLIYEIIEDVAVLLLYRSIFMHTPMQEEDAAKAASRGG